MERYLAKVLCFSSCFNFVLGISQTNSVSSFRLVASEFALVLFNFQCTCIDTALAHYGRCPCRLGQRLSVACAPQRETQRLRQATQLNTRRRRRRLCCRASGQTARTAANMNSCRNHHLVAWLMLAVLQHFTVSLALSTTVRCCLCSLNYSLNVQLKNNFNYHRCYCC